MNRAISKILILGHRNIGDVLHNMALFKPLKLAFPEVKISILTSPIGKDLLNGNPYLSEIIENKKERGFRDYKRRLALIRILRQKKFDLIINLKSGSYFPFFLGGQTIWGVRSNDKTLESKRTIHAIDLYLNVIRNHGIEVQKQDLDMKIALTDMEREKTREILLQQGYDPKKRIIVIAPFSNWHAKEWPLNRFGELSKNLIQKHAVQIAFVGGTQDIQKMKQLETYYSYYVDLVGKLSLRELAALYEVTTLVIGVDSGPFHLAINMGTHAFALFGATSHFRARPYFEPNHVITCPINLGCNPCIPGPNYMICGVYDRATPCMEAISYENVYQRVTDIIKKTLP